jgi:hypothetical protein
MDRGGVDALPRLILHLERFSHMTIERDGERAVVQVVEHIRCYSDGTLELAVHRADDALVGFCETYDDSRLAEMMLGYAGRMGSLVARVGAVLLGCLPLL